MPPLTSLPTALLVLRASLRGSLTNKNASARQVFPPHLKIFFMII